MDWLQSVVARAIDERELHEDGTVHLERLHDDFVIFEGDLLAHGVAAFALPPLHGGEPTPQAPAAVMIERGLDRQTKRVAYAHEVGHLLLGHAGTLLVKELSRAWHEKQEHQAWSAAAMLLIPSAAFLDGETSEELGCRFGVPAGLVERHPALGGLRRFGRRIA